MEITFTREDISEEDKEVAWYQPPPPRPSFLQRLLGIRPEAPLAYIRPWDGWVRLTAVGGGRRMTTKYDPGWGKPDSYYESLLRDALEAGRGVPV